MRRKNVLGALLAGAMILTGCGSEPFQFTESDEWKSEWQMYDVMQTVTPYQKGFYHQDSKGCFCYYDIDSEQSIILCDKNGCDHKREGCYARFTLPDDFIIHEDRLYRVKNDDGTKVISTSVYNTDQKEEFTVLSEFQDEDASVGISEMISTDTCLFYIGDVLVYDENGEVKENDWRIYARNWKTGKEEEICRVRKDKESVEFLAARDDVLYYLTSNLWDTTEYEDTVEWYQKMERENQQKLYRADVSEQQVEEIKTINAGLVIAVNDDLGLLYSQCVGNGFFAMKNLIHMDLSTKEETVLLEAEGQDYLTFVHVTPDVLSVHRSQKVEADFYEIDTMTPIQMEWEYPKQCYYAKRVPTGFAVPKEEVEEGTHLEYGREWKVLPLE